jgi:hypothetical protein
MADAWQLGKTLSDRLQHMLNHQLMCDVTFRVGSTQTLINSHKFMLARTSPVFYNQNPYIEEEHTTQWPKEKVQKGKQRSTKHTYKTKDRVTRTPLKSGGELGCSVMVNSSCSTSDTRRVNPGA